MANIKDLNTYAFPSGQKLIDLEREKYDLFFTKGHSSISIVKGYSTEEEGRILEDSFKKVELDYEKYKKYSTQENKEQLFKSYIDYDVYTRFLVANHTKPNFVEIIKNQTGEYIYDKNVVNYPEGYDDWLKKKNQELEKQIQQQNLKEQEREDIQTTIAVNSIVKDIVIEPYSRKPEDIEAMKLFVSNVSGNDIEKITNDQAQAFIDNLGTTEEAYLTAKVDGTFEYTNNNTYSPDFYKTSEPKEILSIIEDNANHHIIRSSPESEARKNCIKDYEFIHLINEKMNEIEISENKNDKKNALRYHTENILQLNRSIGQLKDNFSGAESQVALNELDNYSEQITKSETPVKADDFLKSIQSIMHVDEEKSKTVRHFTEDNQNNLRISNHSANAVHAKFRPNETSVVIKLSSTKFKTDKDSYLVEYVYDSKNLTKEKQLGIINGLKDWINTGEFTDKQFDKEFYSPTKERYLENKNELKTKQLQALSTRISEMDKELDIWTEKAQKNNELNQQLQAELDKERATHNSSCVITVPQRDSKGNIKKDSHGNPLTTTLNCSEGTYGALSKLSSKVVDLTFENKQLRNQLNQQNNISRKDDGYDR